jgi:hypothetical protein
MTIGVKQLTFENSNTLLDIYISINRRAVFMRGLFLSDFLVFTGQNACN